ncbi:hypothetical protein BN14_11657 [Rhizoctonia solani AG-1 IB]|uniref:Uncharacterized protein n=1 Tax=Thanatephorus cucumeris (strain AG1-IB / isolate 7/3/14) TaxID=1108050 RepID=M5CDL9_THACB|nr:hypothetical protein BN14_11657 [Rhizoctonia solani AG-1 IB]
MFIELFDYMQSFRPSLGDARRQTDGIAYARMTIQWVSGGRVNIETVLSTSGGSLVNKVLRNMRLRLRDKYGIDSEAYARRSKKPERARSDMWNLVVFLRVTQTVMSTLHKDTLRQLEERYVGHRAAGYKRWVKSSKWFGLDRHRGLRPSDPRSGSTTGVRSPRAVGSQDRTSDRKVRTGADGSGKRTDE